MASNMQIEQYRTDVLVLGSGGAGLFGALHAKAANPELDVTVAVKGLLGKCGCTRMVQGGYNVALAPGDSTERHFMDTVDGGKWINRQDLAWKLVTEAQVRIRELENELGCFFDRNPDGSVHQKAFAGQTFDRTVHKGDLTGIEIINRLSEQVWARDIKRLEDHRAVSLVPAADGSGIAGVLMIDMREGCFRMVNAGSVLLATGGGPTMYKFHTPSGDKSCDGMAMAMRAGLRLRDMEMVQFHPTGLIAGEDTRITGTIIEEGLRGAGGYLLDGNEERFMHKYDERNERATRDIVSRAMLTEMRTGATAKNGGLYITMKHLESDHVRKTFKGMVERCADCGFDLVNGLVEVVPTAHYMMGGIEFDVDSTTAMPGLYAAGEDTGGVHGANRLGGNGVANSTVFGGIAGDTIGANAKPGATIPDPDQSVIDEAIALCRQPLDRPAGRIDDVRTSLWEHMWEDAGIIRDADSLERAKNKLSELDTQLDTVGVAESNLAYNLTWHDWLNLKNLILVSKAVAAAATAREESRGARYRTDYPEVRDIENSTYTVVQMKDGEVTLGTEPVEFSIVKPGETLLDEDAA